MTKRQATAQDLIDQLNSMGERIEKAAIAEVRKYLGQRLAGMATGSSQADKEISDCLRESELDLEITDDFRAGLAFAAELVANPRFDY
ncbi:hypothetical protein [Amycolatopsis sp. YIM 10]|uniref:hypothetical protein n=1 Tax=Amycolatopsis sp. YIM 10 TaxID=2653857 RepID=UPI00129012DA|nr:hypothetical protein [Amycolatopsis sp. YIM 10]QFU90947.1 hypothetical protein YIM_28875 [Amycolatopsis sp. YIM 10]